jgi:hypothetical protein
MKIGITLILISIAGAALSIPTANGQEEKIALILECGSGWCGFEETERDTWYYLIRVLNPEDGYTLIGEKKFNGNQLSTQESTIYLDKKWMGKELQFEVIDLSSGMSSLDFVYIVENGQTIDLIEPS